MDDAELRREGMNRLGNVLVPDEELWPGARGEAHAHVRGDPGGKGSISTHELIDEVGKRMDNEESLLYWAHRNKIPIFVPGITDGSFGSQAWMYWQTHRDFKIDLFADEQELSDIIFHADDTGALIVGGGISKHHVIWWNQFKGGLDYAVYLTTAAEYDGSLSGAQVREAVSWGKVKETAAQITVEGDATIALPLIVACIIERMQ